MTVVEDNLTSVSVIIPIYSDEEHLCTCIDSILKQNISLEIILIICESKKGKNENIENYCKNYKNIKIVSQYNKELFSARNKGIEIASGEYILFVDSDDWLKNNSIHTIYNKAKKKNADIVIGNILHYYSDSTIESPFKINQSITNILFSGEDAFIELMKIGCCSSQICNYIYKREWLMQKYFQFKDLLHEEELWTTITLCHAKNVLILNHEYYYYNIRKDLIIQSLYPEERIASLFNTCRLLIQFANRNYNNNKELFGWLYVKVYELYEIAFKILLKIRNSVYKLPSHHLYTFHYIYHKLGKEPLRICLLNYLSAKKNLTKFLKLRISPWFIIGYESNKNQTLILFYNTMWEEPFPINPGDIPYDCIITTDRRYLPEADAVVFHIPTFIDELKGNLDKPTGQIWIAWCQESDVNYPILNNTEFMSLFDLRMTYHPYADIIYPYYEYNYLKKIDVVPFSNKINKCCMIISSRINQSKREEYLKELMQYTDIDSYGSLFKNANIVNDQGKKTKLEIYSKYKFVISFENSIALDYVTEKFFDPLLAGTVPVYLGSPNIEEYAPGENSFINVRKFTKPHQLADFMNACYKNEDLYSQLFEWKKRPLLALFCKKMEAQKTNPFIALHNKVKEKKQELLQNEQHIASLGYIYLCAFTDSRYVKNLKRLKSQAEDMNIFKDMFILDEQDLDESFRMEFAELLVQKVRGYRYEVWKPYLIYQSLQKIEDNAVLLYVDADCHLNYRGKKKFIKYWEIVKKCKSGFLVSQSESYEKEKKWTKGDVFDYFNIRNDLNITETSQLLSSIIFIRKNEQTINFIKNWLSIYYSDIHLIDDPPSISQNMEAFVEYRYNHSLFSILLKMHGSSVFPIEEVYTSGQWGFLERDAPILIKKDLTS